MVKACCALALVLLLFMPAVAESAYVQKSGDDLTLNGQPWKFTGLNDYQTTSCGYDANFPADLTAMGSGKEVVRTWFFREAAGGTGPLNWTLFDSVIADAKAAGVKIIPALVNQWGDCEPGYDYKNWSWYWGGYKIAYPYPESYENYVAAVVNRYKNEDTIAMWQLVNEAEAKDYEGGPCNASSAATVIKNFAVSMGSLIKSIDPNHLVSLGTLGSGQCGTAGSNFQFVHDTPYIDVVEVHDYYNAVIGGDAFNGLQKRIDQAAALNKPIFSGETGIRTDWSGIGTLQNRANLLDQKITAQFGAGVDGALSWTWRDAAHGGSSLSGYEIGPSDPALGVLGAH